MQISVFFFINLHSPKACRVRQNSNKIQTDSNLFNLRFILTFLKSAHQTNFFLFSKLCVTFYYKENIFFHSRFVYFIFRSWKNIFNCWTNLYWTTWFADALWAAKMFVYTKRRVFWWAKQQVYKLFLTSTFVSTLFREHLRDAISSRVNDNNKLTESLFNITQFVFRTVEALCFYDDFFSFWDVCDVLITLCDVCLKTISVNQRWKQKAKLIHDSIGGEKQFVAELKN